MIHTLAEFFGYDGGGWLQASLNISTVAMGLFQFAFLMVSLYEGNGNRLKASAIPGVGVAFFSVIAAAHVLIDYFKLS